MLDGRCAARIRELLEEQEAALARLLASAPDRDAEAAALQRWWDAGERGPQMRLVVGDSDIDPVDVGDPVDVADAGDLG